MTAAPAKKLSIWSAYRGVGGVFLRYWTAYGGIRALLTSPYLHFALFLTVITVGYWRQSPWWELSIAILPSLLGFTLAAFTFLLSLSGSMFVRYLFAVKSPEGIVAFSQLSATMVHFILVQLAGLIVAVVSKALFIVPEHWLVGLIRSLPVLFESARLTLWGAGMFLTMYAFTSCAAATMCIFRLASIRVETERRQIEADKSTSFAQAETE